jgi:hypothetical protein
MKYLSNKAKRISAQIRKREHEKVRGRKRESRRDVCERERDARKREM